MLVAMVTAALPHLDGLDVLGSPAWAMISASRRAASGLAFRTSTLTPLQVDARVSYCMRGLDSYQYKSGWTSFHGASQMIRATAEQHASKNVTLYSTINSATLKNVMLHTQHVGV